MRSHQSKFLNKMCDEGAVLNDLSDPDQGIKEENDLKAHVELYRKLVKHAYVDLH